MGTKTKWVVKSGTDFRNLTLIKVYFSHDGTRSPTRHTLKVLVLNSLNYFVGERRFELERIDITKRFEEDPKVKAIVDEFGQQLQKKMKKVIGWAGVPLDAR